MSDETRPIESGDVYDFSNWECDLDAIETAVTETMQSNLRLAFKEFATGKWQLAFMADDNHGQALEWYSPAYYHTEQPAWITIRPLDLAKALIEDADRDGEPADMLEIGLPLWRQALDHVEAELRRKMAAPPEE